MIEKTDDRKGESGVSRSSIAGRSRGFERKREENRGKDALLEELAIVACAEHFASSKARSSKKRALGEPLRQEWGRPAPAWPVHSLTPTCPPTPSPPLAMAEILGGGKAYIG